MSNNTPAFFSAQLDTTTLTYKYVEGMTLRDYFAAKAMQGMYAASSFPTGVMADTAKEAYAMADVMLEARNAAQ
jgi:hypothetical protein